MALNLPGRPQRAERARRDRGRPRGRRRRCGDRQGARRIQRRGPPLPALRRGRARQAAGAFTLVDDYGHHPAEMAATIAAARGAFPGGGWCSPSSRIATRARATCSRTSCACCRRVDALVLADVYPAGEAPIVAADGRALARAVRVAGKVEPVFVEDIAEMPEAIRARRARRRRRRHDGRGLDRAASRRRRLATHDDGRDPPLPRRCAANSGATSRWRATRAGAPAGARDALLRARGRDDLAAFLRQLPADEPLLFVGLGSNLLVRDGGVRGTVIVMHAALRAGRSCATGTDLRRSRRRRARRSRASPRCTAAPAPSSWPACPAPSAARSR